MRDGLFCNGAGGDAMSELNGCKEQQLSALGDNDLKCTTIVEWVQRAYLKHS